MTPNETTSGSSPADVAGVPLDLSRTGFPAFVIIGRAGSGKTLLTRRLFGENVGETGSRPDVTLKVYEHTVRKTGITIVDTPGAKGLNPDAERAMREYLQLDVPPEERKLIPADVIVFLFTYERLSNLDFDFFAEVKAIYGPKLLLVKNFKKGEDEADTKENIKIIESRTGRKPICVDALSGTGLSALIREMLRMLPANRVLEFNESLSRYRVEARDIAKEYAMKFAAQAAVARNKSIKGIQDDLQAKLEDMYQDIAKAYVPDYEVRRGKFDPVPYGKEDHTTDLAIRAGVGALAGVFVGLLAGIPGMILGGIVGGMIGAGTTPRRFRGGTAAAAEFLTYARAEVKLLDEMILDPQNALTLGTTPSRKWLDKREPHFIGASPETRDLVMAAIKQEGLVDILDSPKSRNATEVELKLRPVADSIF
jgi:predicted GTPase